MDYQLPRGKSLSSVLEATARINLWHGSVRSTKTVSSLLRWYEFVTAEADPGAPLLMAGQTERTLHRNVIDPMIDMFGDDRIEWLPGIGQVRIGDRLVYAQGVGDVRGERKLRGLTLGGAYVDEATIMPEDSWNRLTDRLSVPGAKLFATTNPDSPAHWLNVKWLQRQHQLDMAVFHFTLDDNPFLDPTYVAALKAEHVGVWYRRFIMGEWVAAEGAVWPSFDPDRHVVDTVPPLSSHLVAMDYGAVNPTVGLLMGIGVDPAEGDGLPRLYVAREWRWDSRMRGRQLTDVEQVGKLKEWERAGCPTPEWQDHHPAPPVSWPLDHRPLHIVDPSATSFILQLQAGEAGGVQAADNRVTIGLRAVGNLMAADRIRIHRSCTGLQAEVLGYSWDEKAAATTGQEKPVKVADHAPDAMRYGTMRLWGTWRNWLAAGDAYAPTAT